MSIYDDSVFLLYPSGYKAGTIYSVKPNTSLGDGTVVRNSTKVRVNSDSYLETMAINVLAPDYAGGGCPVFRTDEQSTQLITYPKSLDNVYWTLSGATLDDNGGAGYNTPLLDAGVPTTEAYKLVEDGTTGAHNIIKTALSSTIGNKISVSIRAKYDSRQYIVISSFDPSLKFTYFDLINGTVAQVDAAHSAKITVLADGWYECSITYTPNGTNNARYILYLSDALYTAGTTPEYTGDGTSGVYLCYPQLEEGAYASPLMLPAVEGSTTTRLADAVTGFGDATTFSGVNSSGGMIVRMAAHADDLTERYITLSDGTTSNRVLIGYTGTSNRIFTLLTLGGVSQCFLSDIVTDITDLNNVGFYWDTNDFSLIINGVEVDTDVSGSTFGTNILTTINLDGGGGLNDYYGEIGYVMIGEFTKAQIISQTTP